MTQLSRTKKFQDLRNQLDEETTKAQVKEEQPVKYARLSRVENSHLSHANQPVHSHKETKPTSTDTDLPKSPVMEDLLDEVKRYNIDQGNRITDDTQINILKQLGDGNTAKRNAHFVPMEEDDEQLGSTMKMPKSTLHHQEIDGVATYMPNQKLTRINPIKLAEENSEKEEIPCEVDNDIKKQTEELCDEPIILGSKDIIADSAEESDQLDIFGTKSGDLTDEFDITRKQPKVRKKVKQKKNKKTKKDKYISTDMPSAKLRMKAGDLENEESVNMNKKSGMILNIVLIVLVVLLLLSIAAMIYFMSNIGAF